MRVIVILLFTLTITSCAINNKKHLPEALYQLKFGESPLETYGYPCENGFLKFLHFENKVIVLRFVNNRMQIYDCIVIENDERFEDIGLIEYNGNFFFALKIRNSGNANGHKVQFKYIDRNKCKYYPLEIERADLIYSNSLSEGDHIWNQEVLTYGDNNIEGLFYIWKDTDSHSYPTVGKVQVLYDIEKKGKRKFKVFPKSMNFIEGEFEIQ